MPNHLYRNQTKDDTKVQVSDIESRFHSILGQVSGRLSGLDASAFHQPLLILLVGFGLIFHSLRLFLSILQVTNKPLLFLFGNAEIPAGNAYQTARKSPIVFSESRLASLNELAAKQAAVSPVMDREPGLPTRSSAQVVERDAARIGSAPEVSDTSSVFDASSAPAAIPTLSRKDIILRRLVELSEERHVSPMIFAAAGRQDFLTCSRLIEEGVDCDIPGPGGRRLVHIAAMTGDKQLLRTLNSSSNRIWTTCSRGKIPLDYAASNGHLDVVTYLVESSFHLFTTDQKLAILERSTELARERGRISVANYLFERSQQIRLTQKQQLFREAVAKNDIKRVKRLLKEGISEHPALWDACKRGFTPLVSILLLSTFDGFSYDITNAIDFASRTGKQDLLVLLLCGIDNDFTRKLAAKDALRSSLDSGQVEICEFLVGCAEVDVQYAFQVAAEYKNLHILRWISEREGKDAFHGVPINRAFHAAFSSFDTVPSLSPPLAQFFLENGADVNSKHNIWGTVLQHAAANGNFDLVRYLVSEGGADINALGGLGGSSPMMASISAGHFLIFSYFLGLRTRLDNQHGIFGNVLQTASYLGRRDILVKILSREFDINARLEPYGSALMMAIQGENFDIAELLISRGADINMVVPKYGTALYLAAVGGVENMVKSLIQAGADVNIKGGEFGTPLQAAAANGHQLVVLYLLDCGAQVNAQGGRYGDALQAAQAEGHTLLAKLLLFSGAKVTQEIK